MNSIKNSHDLPLHIQNIRSKLQAMHMPQRELAEKLHLSESAVGRLLQGETALSFDLALQISYQLGMSLDDIAGRVTGSTERRDVDAVVQLYERRLEGVRGNHARLVSEIKETHIHELAALQERYDERQKLAAQHYETRISDLLLDRRFWRIITFGLLASFIVIIVSVFVFRL